MSTPLSGNPSVSHSCAAPTISAEGNLVIGSGFPPDHNVTIRITRAGEDIDGPYLCDARRRLPRLRPTQRRHGQVVTSPQPPTVRIPNGACDQLWSNTYALVLAYT
jgi:hypothetical protein